MQQHGVSTADFNSYGSRRGNHEVMMRSTFANIRIRNEMVPDIEGGYTRHIPSGEALAIYDAAMRYASEQVPLAIVAGKEYGSGSNLIGMGILPLEFPHGETRKTLGLSGDETLDIPDLAALKPGCEVPVTFTWPDGRRRTIDALCRIGTGNELTYYRHDGILHYVIRNMLNEPVGDPA